MNPDEIRAFISEHPYYVLMFNLVLSLLFGSIALVVGIIREKRNLGIIGLITSTIVGIPSWIFSLVASAIFTIVIVANTKTAKDAELPGSDIP